MNIFKTIICIDCGVSCFRGRKAKRCILCAKKKELIDRKHALDIYRSKHKQLLADKMWRQRLVYKFKITVEAYEELFKKQNGGCAICGKQNLNGQRLHIDHDHSTGRIRGLLCRRHNMALGLFSDNPEDLARAIEYLNYITAIK